MSKALNGNLDEFVVVDTNEISWTGSPATGVWRKRLHLVGSAEAGQVTSLVRYDPAASFPEHDHPNGEDARGCGESLKLKDPAGLSLDLNRR